MFKMHCILYYVDTTKNEVEVSHSFNSVASIQTFQSTNSSLMENKKLMFNPNCPIQILLDYLCFETGIDKNMDYDLCDCETGEILNIKQLKPWVYPTDVLIPKHSYIIIFIEKDHLGQYKKIEPFISKQTKQYAEVLSKIKRRVGSLRRISSVTKKTKRRESASSKASSVTEPRIEPSGSRSVLKKRSTMSMSTKKET